MPPLANVGIQSGLAGIHYADIAERVALAEFDTARCIHINHISTACGGDGFVHHGRQDRHAVGIAQ